MVALLLDGWLDDVDDALNKQNFGHELETCGGKPAPVLTVQIEEKRNLTRWLLISCCLVHFAPGSTNSQDPGDWKLPLVGVTVTVLLLFFLLVVFLLIRLVKFWLALKFWRKKSRVLSFSSVQTCSFSHQPAKRRRPPENPVRPKVCWTMGRRWVWHFTNKSLLDNQGDVFTLQWRRNCRGQIAVCYRCLVPKRFIMQVKCSLSELRLSQGTKTQKVSLFSTGSGWRSRGKP